MFPTDAFWSITAAHLVDEALKMGSDMIVVGSHGQGFWRRPRLGSISSADPSVPLKYLALNLIDSHIRHERDLARTKVSNVIQDKCFRRVGVQRSDAMKVGTDDIGQEKRRPDVVPNKTYVDIGHRNSFHVPDEEAISRNIAKHRRFRVIGFLFWRLQGGLFDRASASIVNSNIA